MKKLLLLLFILPLFCFSQGTGIVITMAPPGTPADTINPELYKNIPAVNLSTLEIAAPIINLYTGYLTAKCWIAFKECRQCRYKELKCYRKDDGYNVTFWYDKECKKSKIITTDFYGLKWYNLNWN